jgi:hypothetical protein
MLQAKLADSFALPFSLQRQRKQPLIRVNQMFVAVFRHNAGVFDLHCAPAGFVVRRFEIHRHAGLDGNVGRVGEKWIVDFFRWTEQEWELARFQTDCMAEKEV